MIVVLFLKVSVFSGFRVRVFCIICFVVVCMLFFKVGVLICVDRVLVMFFKDRLLDLIK